MAHYRRKTQNIKSSPHNRNVAFKPQTFYALRFANGSYVDPKKIVIEAPRVKGREWVKAPDGSSEPTLNPSRAFVEEKWRIYETDRQLRDLLAHVHHNRTPLYMVEFKTGFISEDVSDPVVDPLQVRALMIGHHYGEEALIAYRLLIETGRAEEYRYALRRKGGKALMDELMEDNFSYGSLTFLRDEAELVQARLILGDGRPAIYFDLIEYPTDT